MNKKFLSAVIITKNEEHNILRCLTSLIDHTNEIIIYDTGSNDNTCELVEIFASEIKNQDIQVYHGHWNTNFAQMRNEAKLYANGEWILSIDADEFLIDKKFELVKILREVPKECGGLCLTVRNFILNDDIVSFSDTMLDRILRNLPGLDWEGIIYESFVENLLKLDLRLGGIHPASGAKILHTGYFFPDAREFKDRRNLIILDKIIEETHTWQSYLFRAKYYYEKKDLQQAEKDISSCLLNLPVNNQNPHPLNFASVIALENGDLNKAKVRAEASLNVFKGQLHPYPFWILANLYFLKGMYKEAFYYFKECRARFQQMPKEVQDFPIDDKILDAKMLECQNILRVQK